MDQGSTKASTGEVFCCILNLFIKETMVNVSIVKKRNIRAE